jgi:hypothetical protein
VAAPPGFAAVDGSGVDLAPWISGARPASDFPLLDAHGSTQAYDGSGKGTLTSLRTLERKYIEAMDAPERSQFFDLRRDPGEQTNLLPRAVPPDDAERLSAMQAEVQRWIAGHPPAERRSHEIELDPALRLRLLQLGYIE